MVMCFDPSCNHYSERKTCKFFRFPKCKELKEKWIYLISRTDREPSCYSVICSCHFVNGEKNNLPTLLNDGKTRRTQLSPEEEEKKTCENIEMRTTQTPCSEPVPSTSRTADDGELTFQQKCLDIDECSSSFFDVNRSSSRLQEPLDPLTVSSEQAQEGAETYFLTKETIDLQHKLKQLHTAFSFDHIENDDKLINLYTGIPNKYCYERLYGLFQNINLNYYLGWNVFSIPKKDQLLLTLMKLRLNLNHLDLAYRFDCSATTVTNIFLTWVSALHEILYYQLLTHTPTKFKNKSCMAACFSTNCRVIDCVEAKSTEPNSLYKQKLTNSSYNDEFMKGVVGVAPNGVLTFISKLYPSSLSDKKIVQDCGILKKMEVGDLILDDKGFLIKDILPGGVYQNIPPFVSISQFTSQQVIETSTVTRARIQVERTIRRIKCFSILTDIPNRLFPQPSKIFQVCGALTNFQFPLTLEVEHLYGNVNEQPG